MANIYWHQIKLQKKNNEKMRKLIRDINTQSSESLKCHNLLKANKAIKALSLSTSTQLCKLFMKSRADLNEFTAAGLLNQQSRL